MTPTKPDLVGLLHRSLKVGLVLVMGATVLQATTISAHAATPTLPASCHKVTTKVINADKIYVALQYGVVKAATDFIASNSLSNRLLYNGSFILAIKAANNELNLAISSPQCYSAKNLLGYKANVKSNLAQIAGIYSANVHGQLVGDPKKMTTFKPVGLLR